MKRGQRMVGRPGLKLAMGAGLAACLAAGAALAAGSLMAVISGDGEATINGARLSAREVYYFYFAENGRTSFSVKTDAGAIGFSGNVDARPAPHLYTLTVDSIVRTKAGKPADRQAAEGTCELRYGASQTAVTTIDCNATVDGGGKALLHFESDGLPAKVTPIPDAPAG
jgi:hypothetical protein